VTLRASRASGSKGRRIRLEFTSAKGQAAGGPPGKVTLNTSMTIPDGPNDPGATRLADRRRVAISADHVPGNAGTRQVHRHWDGPAGKGSRILVSVRKHGDATRRSVVSVLTIGLVAVVPGPAVGQPPAELTVDELVGRALTDNPTHARGSR